MAQEGLANLAKQRETVRLALKAAGIDNDYGKLRYQLKTNPELRKEVETLFGLAIGYPSGRMEIHHKVFLKNLEPYLFRLNKKGVLELRPQKQINKLIGGLEKHGWKIGDQKLNLDVLPRYAHVGSKTEMPGHLSVHQILRRYYDLQGGFSEAEFANITEEIIDGKPVKFGNKIYIKPDGTEFIDTSTRYPITHSQIGMSEKTAGRIFKSNDIDGLTKEMIGKLDFEAPQMKAAIAATVYLSDDIPEATKLKYIQEYAGKGGGDLDELFDNMRLYEGNTFRNLEFELETLKKQGPPKGMTGKQLDAYQLKLDTAKANLNRQRKLLTKLNDRTTMRQFGFSSRYSPYIRGKNKFNRKLASQLFGSAATAFALSTSIEARAQGLEDTQEDPSILNKVQNLLNNLEVGAESATTGLVTAAPFTKGLSLGLVPFTEMASEAFGYADVAIEGGEELWRQRENIWEGATNPENQKAFIKAAGNPKTYLGLGLGALGLAKQIPLAVIQETGRHGKKRFDQFGNLLKNQFEQSREETAEIPEQSTTVLDQGESAEDTEEELEMGVSIFN